MASGTKSAPIVLVEQAAGVGRITFNRPERLNSLNFEVVAECRAALTRFAKAGLSVVVLTGSGRGFCSGADLHWVSGEAGLGGPVERRAAMEQALGTSQELIRELRGYPGIVVTAVNGPAVGGGAGLALAGDLVIAARSAYFALPFVPNLGLIPDLGGLHFMTERLGSARALGLALLGERLDAQEAAQAGLIWQCHDDEAFEAAVAALTERLAILPPSAAVAAKQLVQKAPAAPLGQFLLEELEAQTNLFGEDAVVSVITDFVESRFVR